MMGGTTMAATGNDQLTIVLTLKDRTPFTYRWMQYLNDLACPYPIVIADGGADAALESHLQQADHYPNLRFTYLRYPFDDTVARYYQKFSDVISRVSTPYVLLADNDDFFQLEAAPAFLRFLDDHPAYVSCGGTTTLLQLVSDDNIGVGSATAAGYRATSEHRAGSVTAATGVDKVCHFMTQVDREGLWWQWYYVHRTAAVQQAASIHEFADPVTFELHMHICLLMAGPSQQLKLPFLVSQIGSSQLTSAIRSEAGFIERIIRSNGFGDLFRAVARCAPALSSVERTHIDQAFAQFFAEQVMAAYPALRDQASGPTQADLIETTYRSLRRLLRPLKRLVARPSAPPAPPVRLPAIEKYILAAAR